MSLAKLGHLDYLDQLVHLAYQVVQDTLVHLGHPDQPGHLACKPVNLASSDHLGQS